MASILRSAIAALAILLIAQLATAAPALAAGSRPPLTEMEVIGGCIGASHRGELSGCTADREVCEAIRGVIRARHRSAQLCAADCSHAVRPIRQYYFTYACRYHIQNAIRLCQRFCYDNYSE